MKFYAVYNVYYSIFIEDIALYMEKIHDLFTIFEGRLIMDAFYLIVNQSLTKWI